MRFTTRPSEPRWLRSSLRMKDRIFLRRFSPCLLADQTPQRVHRGQDRAPGTHGRRRSDQCKRRVLIEFTLTRVFLPGDSMFQQQHDWQLRHNSIGVCVSWEDLLVPQFCAMAAGLMGRRYLTKTEWAMYKSGSGDGCNDGFQLAKVGFWQVGRLEVNCSAKTD